MRRWLDVNFFYTWVLMKTEQERKSDLFHKWTLTIFLSCLIRTTIFCHSWIYDIITYTNRKKCVYCMWSTRQTKSICQLDKEDGWYRLKTIRIFFFYSIIVFLSSDDQPKTIINCTTTPTTCQLNLHNVNRWDSGIYECVATNSIDTIGRFYTLDVQCKFSKRLNIKKIEIFLLFD
jgi:hypothetical protein